MSGILLWECGGQHDLADIEGRLYVPGTTSIRPRLGYLARWAREKSVPRLLMLVTHKEGDPDLATGKPDYKTTFPPHCIAGTDGWKPIPETAPLKALEIPREPHAERPIRESLRIHKGEILLEVAGFDPWAHPTVGLILESVAPEKVAVYGLPADKAIAAVVNGLLDRGLPVILVEDAVKSFDGKAWDQIKAGWAEKGVTWVNHLGL